MRVTELATIAIAGSATIGVIARPWRLPEAIWAAGGALLLVLTGLLPVSRTLIGISKGFDVYLFLIGMMLLAEVAGRQGLFDWLAHHAVTYARGSPRRLFSLIYAVGTVVTVFLSNDATAVVLTPAVYAVAKVARAEPLPYLLICAFIANAASFVLPISNPANLVVFAHHLPGLPHWLARDYIVARSPPPRGPIGECACLSAHRLHRHAGGLAARSCGACNCDIATLMAAPGLTQRPPAASETPCDSPFPSAPPRQTRSRPRPFVRRSRSRARA